MKTRQCSIVGVALAALAVLSTACLDRELRPLNPCLVSGVSKTVKANNVDKVDLLFMVDNSNSMAGEQASLKQQFPNVIKVLATGNRFDGDPDPFPPVKNLHVGVVSSDMGIPGVEFPSGNCHADGGDDGKLQHTPRGTACDAMYPAFLSFIGDPQIGVVSDVSKFSNDVGCIATLGTGGCGFEEQLESPFKALWPKVQLDAAGNVKSPNDYRFISITEEGTWGRGDQPLAQGGNAGFLRNKVDEGVSLIAIVVVTDEEDCSVSKTDHLKPNNQLPEDSPYRMQDINLRCYYNKQFLYDVKDRYYTGFRKLRPGREELVVFAAITGVPPDLVSPDVLKGVDFTSDDASTRTAFYDAILNDPRMQETIDPTTNPGSGQGNLKPSCIRPVPGETAPSTAYPPVRIVQLAKLFDKNGIVQSICQDDFAPAMAAIINIIANQLTEVCLPRKLTRQANGKVACNVVWELPPTAPAGSPTPTQCTDRPFLGPVDPGRAPINSAKGNNCKVTQLPVTDNMSVLPPTGEGWFYDDFTADLQKACKQANQKQRVAFTSNAKPPTGVTVKLECLNETQRLANTRTDLNQANVQPEIGTNCGGEIGTTKISGDAACIITLANNNTLDTMFCHKDLNTCVQKCTSDTDCPPAWVCDGRPESIAAGGNKGAFCVNPTCGADTTE